MTTALKALGMVGAGAMLAIGISASGPTSSTTPTPASVITPITTETKPVIKTDITESKIESVPKAIVKPEVTEIKPVSNCHPSYSGCLKMNAGDYDCASGSGNGPNYTGPVQVHGSDSFDLDRDNDGWGCER